MQWLMISIFVLIFAAYLSKDIFFVAYVFLIPYIVLCLAYIPQGRILTYNTLGDYSYGTYIYAWPIQQTLAITIVGISPLHMFVTAFSFTLLISWLSWNYIEKPSLGLKRHFI
jgi:peptidoglycan/LPS O-acetylase OafA/YrhL